MATSVVTVTVDQDDASGRIRFITGAFAIAAGDYVVGGFDFATKLLAAVSGQSSKESILGVNFLGNAGIVYEYVRSTGKVQIRDAAHALLAAAPVPAPIVADPIRFIALCNKYQ